MRSMMRTGTIAVIIGGSALAVLSVSATARPLDRASALRVMHERHEGMEQIGKATKAAAREVRSSSPNLATVRASAAVIARLAPQLSGWVPAGTGPELGKTGAKPAIWQHPQDFAAKSVAFQKAAIGFNAAARSGNVDAIRANFGAMGKTCSACHDLYRSDMHH